MSIEDDRAMVDMVGIHLPGLLGSPENLSDIKPMTSEGCFEGRLRNLKIKQGCDGVFIHGSLPKYFKGENVLPLSTEELSEALSRIESELKCDLRSGKVRVLEIATTLPVRARPHFYTDAWGTLSKLKKNTYADGMTVCYTNSTRSFSGYDKGEEIAPCSLPALFDGKHGLRLELRWKRKVKDYLKRSINPWDLVTRDIRVQTISAWSELYFAITKRRIPFIESFGGTERSLERALAAIGIQAFSHDSVIGLIHDDRSSGLISSGMAYRQKKRLRSLESDNRFTTSDPLTEEVDDLVREIREMEQ
jgi:hypothetical protein